MNQNQFGGQMQTAGAIYVAQEWITNRVPFGKPERTLFAVRWFDADREELGYWIPEVSDHTGSGVVFETPRVWDANWLEQLRLIEIDRS